MWAAVAVARANMCTCESDVSSQEGGRLAYVYGGCGVRDLISATRSERVQANEREDEDMMMCSP